MSWATTLVARRGEIAEFGGEQASRGRRVPHAAPAVRSTLTWRAGAEPRPAGAKPRPSVASLPGPSRRNGHRHAALRTLAADERLAKRRAVQGFPSAGCARSRGVHTGTWKRPGNDRVKPDGKTSAPNLVEPRQFRTVMRVRAARRSQMKALGHTCHAGGRGFESRRSRQKPCKTVCRVAWAGSRFRPWKLSPAQATQPKADFPSTMRFLGDASQHSRGNGPLKVDATARNSDFEPG
jgi:hypothetical protein